MPAGWRLCWCSPMIESIDQVRLNFNPQAQLGLGVVLALVMFGIALDLRVAAWLPALSRSGPRP